MFSKNLRHEMAFRAVYIISSYDKDLDDMPKLIFKRTFPVIERKHKLTHGDMYSEVPKNFTALLVREINKVPETNSKISESHSCTSNKTTPVYNLVKENLYPVVAFQKDRFIYCCIVSDEMNGCFPSSGVLMAVIALEGMSSIMDNTILAESLEEQINSLHRYILVGFPFGIPVELNVNTVFALLSTVKGSPVLKSKAPIWRPVLNKGKQCIQLTIKETIKALQFDQHELADVNEIFGTVFCKADLEEAPEITLSLQCLLYTGVLSQMSFHSCVKQVDELTSVMEQSRKEGEQLVSRKIRFCPPYESFPLCHYKARSMEHECPVKASFKMKGSREKVDILIQIFLDPRMKNSFEFFNVVIPFFNRGPITSVTFTPSSSAVNVSESKSELLWCLGNKFTRRGNDFESSIELSVSFSSGDSLVKDQFLVKVNSYIKICFKTRDFTYSGLSLEGKSIEIYPSTKAKICTSSEFESQEFKVWNYFGDVTDTSFS